MNKNFNNEQSVSLSELINLLDKIQINGSTIGSETVSGVYTESRVVMITPQIAKLLLERNTLNRPLKKNNVKKLAKAMLANEWNYDGTPLSFDKYGTLLNGQHRLFAIINSGKSLVFKVTTGLLTSMFATMDSGNNRTLSDGLAIAGYKNPKLLSLTTNFLYRFLLGQTAETGSGGQVQLNVNEAVKFIEVKPFSIDAVDFVMQNRKKDNVKIIPNQMIGGLYLLFHEKDVESANIFFEGLLTGASLDSTSPILQTRNRFLKAKEIPHGRGLSHGDMTKLIVNGWNQFRRNERVKTPIASVPKMLPVII